MYVWSNRPLDSGTALEEAEIVFRVLPSRTKSVDIFSKEYEGRKRCDQSGKLQDNWRLDEFRDEVWIR